jgi:guanylate kinase
VTPFPIILSAPSGAGKTTIAHRLLAQRSDVGYSVSCTTRPPRAGEVNGRDYHFLSDAQFLERRERGDFAESAGVHGKMYGTLKSEVARVLNAGRHVLMDIDVQGAEQFARAFPMSVLVFVLPPSAEILLSRLTARQSENRRTLVTRLQSASEELRQVGHYHYVVVNDELERAVRTVSSIIDAEAVRQVRVPELASQVSDLVRELERSIQSYSE